jgi:hypothetical protein
MKLVETQLIPRPFQQLNVDYVLKQHSVAKAKGRAFSFDRHVYFIDFRNFTSDARNPIWFSSIRLDI